MRRHANKLPDTERPGGWNAKRGATPSPSLIFSLFHLNTFLLKNTFLHSPPRRRTRSFPAAARTKTDSVVSHHSQHSDDDDDSSPRARSARRSNYVSVLYGQTDRALANSPLDSCRDETVLAKSFSKKITKTASTFLVGAYAKYDRPYAWLRGSYTSEFDLAAGTGKGKGCAGSEEGGSGNEEGGESTDLPLDLTCTTLWELGVYRVWDLVDELVGTRTFPKPTNVFAVDFSTIKKMPKQDRYLSTGALVSFLRDVLHHESDGAAKRRGEGNGTNDDFERQVLSDVEKLVEAHFADVPEKLIMTQ